MKKFFLSFAAASAALCMNAQAMFINSARMADVPADESDSISVCDSLMQIYGVDSEEIFNLPVSLPDVFFMPPVFDKYSFYTPLTVSENVYSGNPEMRWIEDYDVLARQMQALNQNLFFNHPELVRYNMATLPEAPKQYVTVLDPSDFSISIRETVDGPADVPTIAPPVLKKKHWIRTFSASLQFSQAYVSPNWYQGGNNNLNALGNIFYNVKLNEAYHPKLLFETTVQYKLGMNNAPDDSIHAHNISEDIFQINTTFGVKAAKRWYYSFTGQFKTQLLNSYKSNTREMKSAFLSPGELTAGIGMTYAYENVPKTLKFDASIAPVSYQLTTCTNSAIDPSLYGIDPGHKTVSKFGSSVELKLAWRIAYNIVLNSRIFAFTDYDSFYADWENTLAFEINKFLTTQIYAHLRYDTQTPRVEDTNWKKLQIKEIFSIGFAYKFSSI